MQNWSRSLPSPWLGTEIRIRLNNIEGSSSVGVCVHTFLSRKAGWLVAGGGLLKPGSPSVPATLIAFTGIDLSPVQGQCTRGSCLPSLAPRQGPVAPGCGWAWVAGRTLTEPLPGGVHPLQSASPGQSSVSASAVDLRLIRKRESGTLSEQALRFVLLQPQLLSPNYAYFLTDIK